MKYSATGITWGFWVFMIGIITAWWQLIAVGASMIVIGHLIGLIDELT